VKTAPPLASAAARAAAVVLAALTAGCGSSPIGPMPSPSPSPTAQPGGTITGRYTLSITPSVSCAMSRTPITFLMTGADAGVTTHPGVQVLLDPNGSFLELEAVYESFAIHGGLGTSDAIVVSEQGQRVWVRAIASGPIVRATDGRGELRTGALAGYLALAPVGGFEGDLGTCSAADHALSLRTR
jgi:ABC-type phosphate transport system substrate-binding protein